MTELKTIKGIISVGKAHPLYKKEVDLYVITENTGYDGRGTWVRTVEEVLMPVTTLVCNKYGKVIREESHPSVKEYVEGWLERD